MADTYKFGNAGSINVTTDRGGAVLDLSQGDYITYEVKTRGANAQFAFAAGGQLLKSVNAAEGIVNWALRPHDMPTADDIAGIRFVFASGALLYAVQVLHVKADGSPILTLKNFEIATTDPEDIYLDTIRVFVV